MSAAGGLERIMMTEKGKPRCKGRMCGARVEGLPGKVARYEEAQCARACEEGSNLCKVCSTRYMSVLGGEKPLTWHGVLGEPIANTSLIIGGPRNIALRAAAAKKSEEVAAKAAAAAEKAAEKAAAVARAATAKAEKAAAAAAAKAEREAKAAAAKAERETKAAAAKAATEARKAAAAAKRATTARRAVAGAAHRKTARRSTSSSSNSSSSNSSSSNSSSSNSSSSGSSSSRTSSSSRSSSSGTRTVTSPRLRATRRRTTSSSGRTSSSPRRSTSSRPPARRALPLGVGSIAELVAAARAGPRSNTPITPATPSNGSIYRPASAGSAPRMAAPAAGYATPVSSPKTVEYSSNFESESAATPVAY